MRKRLMTVLTAVTLSAMLDMTAFAGGWKYTADGRRWFSANDSDTEWYAGGWMPVLQPDHNAIRFYYLDDQGYMLTNTTTPDGHQVNEKGEWVKDGQVQTAKKTPKELRKNEAIKVSGAINQEAKEAKGWKQESNGKWRYGYNGQWLTDGFRWISNGNGQMELYCFDKDGYAYTNASMPDGRWMNADGKWETNGTVQKISVPIPTEVLTEQKMQETLTNQGKALENELAKRDGDSAGNTFSDANWQSNGAGGWSYIYNGNKLANGWWWIYDGNIGAQKGYYFDGQGNLLTNTTTPDGYYVNGNGEWERNSQVMTFKRDGAVAPQREDSTHAQFEQLLDLYNEAEATSKQAKESVKKAKDFVDQLDRMKYGAYLY